MVTHFHFKTKTCAVFQGGSYLQRDINVKIITSFRKLSDDVFSMSEDRSAALLCDEPGQRNPVSFNIKNTLCSLKNIDYYCRTFFAALLADEMYLLNPHFTTPVRRILPFPYILTL